MFFESVPAPWQPPLMQLRDEIDRLGADLRKRADNGERILPDKSLVFRALEIAPDDVRILILGQDPYPNANDACGLAFAVRPRQSGLPGSLLNIQKEILTDIGSTSTADGDLSRWSAQGVMLLNRVLTVSAGDSGSHSRLGWEKVTERIVAECAKRGAIGILWGNSAKELASHFPSERLIEGVHPSPLSAHRGFLGSRPFSRANEILRTAGYGEITW